MGCALLDICTGEELCVFWLLRACAGLAVDPALFPPRSGAGAGGANHPHAVDACLPAWLT
eukprot:3840136-Pyramimonas_sp.AAC.1